MSHYNMNGLEDLAGVPNIATVIERIDNAATKATMLYRMTGMTFGRKRAVPTQDDVDDVLRSLVATAAEECYSKQEQRKNTQQERPVLINVDGFAEDDTFEVLVKCDAIGNLDVDVLLRLV